jgi:hypothetical protein
MDELREVDRGRLRRASRTARARLAFSWGCACAAFASCGPHTEPAPPEPVKFEVLDRNETWWWPQGLHPVDASDRNQALVQQEIQRIEAGTSDPFIGNKMERVGKIQGEASRALFPTWDFYSFEYSQYAKPGSTGRENLAFSLGHTLAVCADDPAAPRVMRLSHSGNYEPYGELLQSTRTLLHDVDDARRVWAGFCEVHRLSWQTNGIEQLSDHQWKVGISSYEQTTAAYSGMKTIVQRTHWYEIHTDPATDAITFWQSHVDTSAPRYEPY